MNTTINSLMVVDDLEAFIGGAGDERSPEERLLMAVVERAVRDYLGGSIEDQDCAEQWLFSECEENLNFDLVEPFSFAWICHALSLDLGRVRSRIRNVFEMSRTGALPFYVDKRFMHPPELRA